MSSAARGRLVLLLTTALAVALAVLTPALPASADDSGSTTVYVPTQACAAPAPGHATCFAMRLVAKRVARDSAAARSAPDRSHAGRGPAGGFTPGQVATAYAVDRDTAASEQVIALVDAYHSPDVVKNLNTFDARYHLPKEKKSTFRVVDQRGGSTLPRTTNKGWAGETDLDVQAVRGLCRTCKILLVEATTDGTGRLGNAVDGAASYRWRKGDGSTLPVAVVSNSYGGAENSSGLDLATTARHYDHPGVAILAASGDAGWFGWDYSRTDHPEYADRSSEVPASLPTVVGVGGTTLQVTATGARDVEAVWNRDGNEGGGHYLGATGSGCSEIYDARPWQAGAAGYDTLGCTPGKRSEVDVAALADPLTGYDVFTAAHWSTYGGTSLATPLMAALWGLAGGPRGVDYPARTLYTSLATGTGLYDVTLGGNGLCGRDTASQCQRVVGGNPNRLGYGPRDCQFAWTGHDAGAAASQCNARAGIDGPSGVGVPTGLGALS